MWKFQVGTSVELLQSQTWAPLGSASPSRWAELQASGQELQGAALRLLGVERPAAASRAVLSSKVLRAREGPRLTEEFTKPR